MKTSFISAATHSMSPAMLRACSLWAGLRIAEHDTPDTEVVEVLECLVAHTATDITAALLNDSCASGIRSAILSQLNLDNFRIHAEHALIQLAKQQGLHFVEAMLNDTFESGTSPLEVAA